jgi:hypothetical protein
MSGDFLQQIDIQKQIQQYQHKVLAHAWAVAKELPETSTLYYASSSNKIIARQSDSWDTPEKINNFSQLCSIFDRQLCLNFYLNENFIAKMVYNCLTDEDSDFVDFFYDYSQDFLDKQDGDFLNTMISSLHKKPETLMGFMKNAHADLGYLFKKDFPDTARLIKASLSEEDAIIALSAYLKKQQRNIKSSLSQEEIQDEVIHTLENTFAQAFNEGKFNELDYIQAYQKYKSINHFAFELPENPVISLTINYNDIKYYLDFSYLVKKDVEEWVHRELFNIWKTELIDNHQGLEKISYLYWGKNNQQKPEMQINPDTENVQTFLSITPESGLSREVFTSALKSLLIFLKDNNPFTPHEMNQLTAKHQKAYWLNYKLNMQTNNNNNEHSHDEAQESKKFKI